MRARIAFVVLAVGAGAPLACEGVPDLHFAAADGSAPGSDAGGAAEDAGAGHADATTLPADAAQSPPPDADVRDTSSPAADSSTSGSCPDNPPAGTTCCGSVVCKGTAAECQCGFCGMCATEGFCCPFMGRYAMCATSLAACPGF